MAAITLVPHDLKYAERLYQLSADPRVYEHLAFRNESVADVIGFVEMVQREEVEGKTVSRVILNEREEVIGVTTLMEINRGEGTCSLGSWLGFDYWGKGYNRLAKEEILMLAFQEAGCQVVFVGARKTNIRSQRAQEKLPYFTINAERKFPEVHQKIELKENCPCYLNVVYREDFFNR